MTTGPQTLSPELIPELFSVPLPEYTAQLINGVETELSSRARLDPDQCFGYFPGLTGHEGIDHELPYAETFKARIPTIGDWLRKLSFNFLRLSLVRQPGSERMHLDSDASTALTGDVTNLQQRRVWRALLNLSNVHGRRLEYLGIDPFTLPLQSELGYTSYALEATDHKRIKTIIVPPRNGSLVHGVLLCASQVLHTGIDDDHGHFVASYGYEESA